MSNGLTVLDGGTATAEINQEIVQANAGRKIAKDSPEQWQKQSWKGYYKDPTRENIHVLLHHMFYGTGGFAGNIPADNDTNTINTTDFYSYIHPKPSERYYRTRVKDTPFHNRFGRIVDSQITPIFSVGRLATMTYSGETMQDDQQMKTFMRDCTGSGTPYNAMQEYILRELIIHDVAFYALTKRKNRDVPVLTAYRTVDHMISKSNEYGELVEIWFSTGIKKEKDTTYQKAVKYVMMGGACWIINMIARDEPDRSLLELKWEDDKEKPAFNTQISEMVIRAQLPEASPTGEWLPEVPKSKRYADICMDIWQYESKISWLITLLNLPIFNIYGDVVGVQIGAGNAIQSGEGATGYAPTPEYISPDAGLLTADIAYLEFKDRALQGIAKENGVNTVESSSAQSGDSKRFDFQATEMRLQNSIALLEDLDSWIFRLFNLYLNRGDVIRYERKYPESFYPEEEPQFADMETVFTSARDNGANKTASLILKAMAMQLLKKQASTEDLQVITEEIESIVISAQQSVE